MSKSYSLREGAKVTGFPGGVIKFNEWLKAEKFLMPHLEPYQKYIDQGLFTYSLKNIKAAKTTVCVTRITIKGLYVLSYKLHGKSKLYK